MTRLRRALREVVGITLCAVALGLTYTSVQKKGFFGEPPRTGLNADSPAPEVIHMQEALTLFQSGEALFIDSRHEFDYKLGHIKGAINIPLNEFDQKQEEIAALPNDRVLVVYCDGIACNSSIELATRLKEKGLSMVKVFFAGWTEWQNQRLPEEVTQ